MARPIEPTPILKGKDKEIFLKEINNVKYSPEKEIFLKECDKIYNIISKKQR